MGKVISLELLKDLLNSDPFLSKSAAEAFVESVIIKKDTIEIAFKVS